VAAIELTRSLTFKLINNEELVFEFTEEQDFIEARKRFFASGADREPWGFCKIGDVQLRRAHVLYVREG